MDRAFRRSSGGPVYTVLPRSLLFPQIPRTRTQDTEVATPRLLHLVVPGAEDFFRRLPPENWPCTSPLLPLGARIPVLVGVARVLSRPEHWIDKLASAAAKQRLLHSVGGPRVLGWRRATADSARATFRAADDDPASRCRHPRRTPAETG
jgi:hypothetical protein